MLNISGWIGGIICCWCFIIFMWCVVVFWLVMVFFGWRNRMCWIGLSGLVIWLLTIMFMLNWVNKVVILVVDVGGCCRYWLLFGKENLRMYWMSDFFVELILSWVIGIGCLVKNCMIIVCGIWVCLVMDCFVIYCMKFMIVVCKGGGGWVAMCVSDLVCVGLFVVSCGKWKGK